MAKPEVKSLILWADDSSVWRPIEKELAATGTPYEVCEADPTQLLLDRPGSHVVVADFSLGPKKISSLREKSLDTPLVLLFGGSRSDLINNIFAIQGRNHALGRNELVLPHEIIPLRVLTAPVMDPWTLMCHGTDLLFTAQHWDGSMVSHSVDQARIVAGTLDTYSDFENYVATCVWELLTNAIYDARRGTDIELPRNVQTPIPTDQRVASQLVDLEIRHDAHKIAVRIQDHLGRLTPSMVIENWRRADARSSNQIKGDHGGAGVGLYMVLHEAAQLIFNIRHGTSTEVIFTIPIERSNRSFMTRVPSIHFFEPRN